ncbi:RNA-directed DNA polymerase, eukaryota [Tanacetum coccineum]|uniref:RNA-directed DNA polymerase, eukaryota n=1 Tax=Tanacetum coccineum TaxID=301880 RepID=A0ABQ5IXF5_9ASTR
MENSKSSFVSVLKHGNQSPVTPKNSKPTLVLDESCIKEYDFGMSLMGKEKYVYAIPNLPCILSKEGFQNVKLSYLGGMWVLFELDSLASKEKFLKHTGIGSWFSDIIQGTSSFVNDERIVWVSIEGLPIKAWTPNTFRKIASLWVQGKVQWIRVKELDAWSPNFQDDDQDDLSSDEESQEDDVSNKDDKTESDVDRVSESSFMHENDFVHKDVTCSKTGEVGTHSEDPFNIYGLLDGQKNKACNSGSEDPKFPPGLGNKVKRSWIKELCQKHIINFVSIQETKAENIDLRTIKDLWGNQMFDHVVGPSVGCSGGIICVWNPNMFVKEHVSTCDYFVSLMGTWTPTSSKLLIISVYAPQELNERRDLWDYLRMLIGRWEGDTVIMGDFNEVRSEHERVGSTFNRQGAIGFNNFISSACLIDLPLEGYDFTWAHKSASKMSKLDRFLISEGLLELFPHLSALCLDRHLSDHRPILMRETNYDYSPSPFWSNDRKINLQHNLSEVDKIIDQGKSNDEILNKRITLLNELQELNSLNAIEISQKAKVRWSIEGDENSKYFHGILNKKRSQLAIRGTLVNGEWISEPHRVKNEFFTHFKKQFSPPQTPRICSDFTFPTRLSSDQVEDLECIVTYDEVKRATTLDEDVFQAVRDFFVNGHFPRGCNSSFIALIPKIQDAKFVKDFRLISLIGSVYKIISKILANRLCLVLPYLISDVQSAFVSNRQILDGPFILNKLLSWCKFKKSKGMIFKVDFEKAFDSVKWDYLDETLKAFGFGSKWCKWISSCLNNAMGSVLVNGSPTLEFQFHKGSKQGDPISPFLFILIMETLHLSFKRVLTADIYKGISLNNSFTISHLFYADDVVFIGEWNNNNIQILLSVLKCFYLASGLKINLHKSKLMGIGVSSNVVESATSLIGCSILTTPFNYLGVKVGGNMSRISSWDEVISKVSLRLSKWKLKLLSIGGRLTLLKSVLTSIPLYHMSIFKVPKGVLNNLESILQNFFYGSDGSDRKLAWIGWNTVLASKKNGGLYAHNRALLFKWVWRFLTDDTSLWTRFIKAIFGNKGALDTCKRMSRRSPWIDVIHAIHSLQSKGEVALKDLYKRLYALEMCKSINRWSWSLEGSCEFSVKSSRILIDEKILPKAEVPTRWINVVPIKVNIHAWRVCLDKLPTRVNLSLRGVDIPSIFCPLCNTAVESTSHFFFSCPLTRQVGRNFLIWWELEDTVFNSYNEWLIWLVNSRLQKHLKEFLEGICYVIWWLIWRFRNQLLFGISQPRRALLFDDVVQLSYM